MRNGIVRGSLAGVVACSLALVGASGCTYLNSRLSDAKQMMDLGFTFSKKPQFGLYANCPMVTPVGYSKVDGYFVGVGGGKLGAGEHHQNNAGALFWGREENSWKGMGKDDKATVESHRAGVVGIAQNAKDGSAKYRPACIHYLHLGYVGVMWNLNYFKMADFFCGWFGYIPFGDRSEAVRVAGAPGKGATPFKPGPPVPEPVAAARPAPPAAPAAATSPAPRPAGGATTLAQAPTARPAEPAPNEVALEVARDVAAVKAEKKALAPPKGKFSLEQLVP